MQEKEIWEDSITPEANKDHKSINRKILGERSLATGDGMYTLAVQYYFIITFFFHPVAQVNMFHQAKDVQIINSVVTTANTVSNWLI